MLTVPTSILNIFNYLLYCSTEKSLLRSLIRTAEVAILAFLFLLGLFDFSPSASFSSATTPFWKNKTQIKRVKMMDMKTLNRTRRSYVKQSELLNSPNQGNRTLLSTAEFVNRDGGLTHFLPANDNTSTLLSSVDPPNIHTFTQDHVTHHHATL